MRRASHEFTFGWAITCHKAQGSQWDAPIIFDESRCFREHARNWLYTAITRAADRVVVVL
jgi:exodeoxyribonuclease-5